MLKKIVTAVALVSACGLASSAMAAKALDHGFYVDANVGFGKYQDAEEGSVNAGKDHASVKASGFVWNVNAGYKFMPYVAADLGYWMPHNYTADVSVAATSGNIKITNSTIVLAVKGILPLGADGFSLYGKVGPAWQHLKLSGCGTLSATGDYPCEEGTHSGLTLYAGLGAEYNITSNMYVGMLGSYFMKRDSDNNGALGYYAVTGNFGYMF